MRTNKADLDAETLHLMYCYAGSDLWDREKVREVLVDETDWDGAFMDFLAMLNDLVPENLRATARVSVKRDDDDQYYALRVYHDRLETDDEIDARAARALSYARDRQARERAEFARLRAKFEA